MDTLATLLARLDECHDQHAQDQTAGSIDALGAVIHFLKSNGATEGQTLPLVWLGYQFTRKEPGNVKPLFLAGREGIAAAAIDALMQSGMTEKAASDEVSKATGGIKTGKQLCDWRGNVREGKTRAEARDQYDDARRVINALRKGEFAGADASTWRKGVLAMVAHSYGLEKA